MRSLDRSFEWKIPIKFYGSVIDQEGQPVPDASVRYGWNDVGGSHHAFTKSDASGRFAIEGIRGKILTVDVSKEGYHTSEENQIGFEYAAFFEADYHRPDASNPVTFRLVMQLAPEPLIAWGSSVRILYDRPAYYELVRGTMKLEPPAGAGLKITVERSEAPQGQPFAWKCRIEAVKGALLETKAEFAQSAPENGYVSAWEVSGTRGYQPFSREGPDVRLYFRTDDSRFALVEIELSHPMQRSLGPRLIIESFLNPSGSRNLNYDRQRSIPRPPPPNRSSR